MSMASVGPFPNQWRPWVPFGIGEGWRGSRSLGTKVLLKTGPGSHEIRRVHLPAGPPRSQRGHHILWYLFHDRSH